MIHDFFTNIDNKKILYVASLVVIIPSVLLLFSFLMLNGNDSQNQSPTPSPDQFREAPPLLRPQIKSPSNINTNELGSITFSFADRALPTKSKLIYSKTEELNPESYEKIALDLSFISDPEIRSSTYGNIQIFKGDGQMLSFYTDIGRVEYVQTPSTESARLIESLSVAESIAREEMAVFSDYATHLSPDIQNADFYRLGGDLVVVDGFDEADVISIPFVYTIDGKHIYGQYGERAAADVWLNKSGQVLKITVRNAEGVQREQEVDLISLDEAKAKIVGGEGMIVSIGEAYHSTAPVTTIETADFKSVSIDYLRDSSQGVLYPIYVFSGTAQSNTGLEEIIVYLSALK